MKIVDFIELYETNKVVSDVEKILKEKLEIKNYIPHGEKIIIADSIIKNSCLTENGEIKIDSCKRFILYIVAIIDSYTNIEIDMKHILDEYDLLNEKGLVEIIIKLLPEKELKDFTSTVQMKYDDFMINSYETHNYISKEIEKIASIFSSACGGGLESLAKKIEQIDEKKLSKLLNKINKNVTDLSK